jgi:hypothetical protein
MRQSHEPDVQVQVESETGIAPPPSGKTRALVVQRGSTPPQIPGGTTLKHRHILGRS